MNKVILMGRLTRDPETRYSQSAEPVAICRYSLAVNKRFKREGEPDADFINCTALGRTGEFADKYFKKGLMVSVVGRLSVRSWEDQNGQRRWSTEVVVEEQYFAESKSSFESHRNSQAPAGADDYYESLANSQPKPTAPPSESGGFAAIDESLDDEELPF